MSYNQYQIALKAHIEQKNAIAQEWVDAASGRWASMTVTDLDHWAEYEIYTIAQYEHYQAQATHYDFYKEVNGIRPRWMDYDSMTTEEIEDDIARLNNQHESESEYEQWFDQMREENHKYNDLMLSDPEPTKYELIAESAGF